MIKFRKIWNEEANGFLAENKDLPRKEIYQAFIGRFPEYNASEVAVYNQLSRLGLRPHRKHGSTRHRPLYAEQIKKGYIRIKVAEPNVWMMKSKWVYMESHPWEDFSERSNYIFLDGDNRNFHPDNIERVPIKLMALFNSFGGTEKGHPQVTRLRILQAKMKIEQFNLAERLGLTGIYNGGRFLKAERNRYARQRIITPEERERRRAAARRRYHKKRQDPLWVEHYRAYQKEWARKKRRKNEK